VKTALHFPRDVRWAAGPSEKVELQSFNLTETETLMTDERLALAELAAKSRADLAHVADQLRTRWPKLGTFMDDAETDALAYPYLLRKLAVTRPNQVWAMDLTYFPMARGFVYLCAVVDWFSRRALSWRLSITMEAAFCIEAVEEAIARWQSVPVRLE